MDSIQEQINSLYRDRDNFQQELNNRGVGATESDTFTTLVDRLRSMPANSGLKYGGHIPDTWMLPENVQNQFYDIDLNPSSGTVGTNDLNFQSYISTIQSLMTGTGGDREHYKRLFTSRPYELTLIGPYGIQMAISSDYREVWNNNETTIYGPNGIAFLTAQSAGTIYLIHVTADSNHPVYLNRRQGISTSYKLNIYYDDGTQENLSSNSATMTKSGFVQTLRCWESAFYGKHVSLKLMQYPFSTVKYNDYGSNQDYNVTKSYDSIHFVKQGESENFYTDINQDLMLITDLGKCYILGYDDIPEPEVDELFIVGNDNELYIGEEGEYHIVTYKQVSPCNYIKISPYDLNIRTQFSLAPTSTPITLGSDDITNLTAFCKNHSERIQQPCTSLYESIGYDPILGSIETSTNESYGYIQTYLRLYSFVSNYLITVDFSLQQNTQDPSQDQASGSIWITELVPSSGATYTAGANINIDANNVISATDTTYGNATQSTSGLMSATDKTKLDNMQTNMNNIIYNNRRLNTPNLIDDSNFPKTECMTIRIDEMEKGTTYDLPTGTFRRIGSTYDGTINASYAIADPSFNLGFEYTLSLPAANKRYYKINNSSYYALAVTTTRLLNDADIAAMVDNEIQNLVEFNAFIVKASTQTTLKKVVLQKGFITIKRTTVNNVPVFTLVYPAATARTEVDLANYYTSDTLLTTTTGYDATKTQVLKNINGVLTWVNESV